MRVNMNLQHVELGWSAWGGGRGSSGKPQSWWRSSSWSSTQSLPRKSSAWWTRKFSRKVGLPRFETNLSAAAVPALSEGVFGMDKSQKTDQAWLKQWEISTRCLPRRPSWHLKNLESWGSCRCFEDNRAKHQVHDSPCRQRFGRAHTLWDARLLGSFITYKTVVHVPHGFTTSMNPIWIARG